MRLLFAVALAMFCTSQATAEDFKSIAPGMHLKEVTAALVRHGYGVGPNHGSAIVSSNKGIELEFCSIDAQTTLVISYQKEGEQVVSLDVYFYPEESLPKVDRRIVQRKARRISFDEDDVFTVSLERVAAEPKGDSRPLKKNLFE